MSELPKIVRERLAQMPAGTHPDPDLLNAFAEHTLAPRERGLVMAHVSACQECRQLISLAALPLRHAEPSPSLAEPARGWFSWGYMRWSGAVAAVLVVASIALLYQDRWRRPELSPVPQPATAKMEAAPTTAEDTDRVSSRQPSLPRSKPAEAAPARKRDQPRGDLQAKAGSPAAPPPPPPPATSNDSDAVGAGRTAPSATASGEVASGAQNSNYESKSAQTRELPVNEREQARDLKKEKDEKLDSLALMTPGKANEKPRAEEVVDVEASAPLVESTNSQVAGAAGEKRSADSASVARQAGTRRRSNAFSLKDESGDWRLAAGVLERSADGRSWKTALSVPDVRFTALAVLGNNIWVGGSSGVVYVSQDNGRRWLRRQVVTDGAEITADVIGIALTGAGSATIMTGAVSYTTTDAGATWTRATE